MLVFVEVKARSSEPARPAAAVNVAKQRRIVAAREYVRMLPDSKMPIRFDIVEVLLDEGRVGKCGINPMHLPARVRVDCAGAGTARSRNPCASFESRFAGAPSEGDRASRQKCVAGYCGPICRRCFRGQDPAGPAAKYLLFDLETTTQASALLLGHLGMTGRMYVQLARATLPKPRR